MEARINYQKVAPGAYEPMLALGNYLRKSALEESLINLLCLRASQINGCAYCIDMHWKDLRAAGESEQRLYGLDAWEESPYYSERERGALAWTEAVTNLHEGHVPDEVYERVRRVFTEKELADLTLAVVAIKWLESPQHCGQNCARDVSARQSARIQERRVKKQFRKRSLGRHPGKGGRAYTGNGMAPGPGVRAIRQGGAMKLLVLGATGGTGLEIVMQASEHGHEVTAFVRNPERLKTFGERIAVIRGDVLDGAQLAGAIAGHDAVLSAFGPRYPVAKSDADLLHRFAIALTSGMRQAGVKRVAVESVAFLFKDAILPPAYLVGRLFFPMIVADANAMEQIISKSGLDWTIVRPPRLTNLPRTGMYRVREGHLPSLGFTISRADVADYMLAAIEQRKSIGRVVGVCN